MRRRIPSSSQNNHRQVDRRISCRTHNPSLAPQLRAWPMASFSHSQLPQGCSQCACPSPVLPNRSYYAAALPSPVQPKRAHRLPPRHRDFWTFRMAPQIRSLACLPPVRLQILTVPRTYFPAMLEHCAALHQLDGTPSQWSTDTQASGKPHNAVLASRS